MAPCRLSFRTSPRHDAIVLRTVTILVFCLLSSAAPAIVGGARKVGLASEPIVMIIGARGNKGLLCTGTALARDLVLTSAHCVAASGSYRLLPSADATSMPIKAIARHPRFDPHGYERGRATADLALLKLARPLPAHISPVALAPEGDMLTTGERLQIAGFGLTVPGKDFSTGVPHVATLVVTGRPTAMQVRLVDPVKRGERFGLGGCVGDSGGPVLRVIDGKLSLVGVVSWSTGPGESEGCGGITGVTPITLYRGWIVVQAAKMGVMLARQ